MYFLLKMSGDTARETTVEALGRASFANPKFVIGTWLLILGVSALGLKELSVETNTESVLDHRSEPWRFYLHSQDLFGIDEAITVAIHGGSFFDRDSLALVLRLTEQLESLDGVRRIDSLATVPIIESDANGEVHLSPPLESNAPTTDAEARKIGLSVLADRIMPSVLASKDGRVLALNIMLDAHGVNASSALLESIYRITAGERTWISGVPVFRVETDARTRSELSTFIPLTVLAIAALLYFIFRSVAATIVPLVVGSCGTAVVMGVMGALSVPLTISTVILPSVFLAMGCAYSIHLLIETAGLSGKKEISGAIVRVARPLAFSGLTTAIGFAAVAVVPIDALRQLGGFGALGTFTVVFAALTVGPAVLALWPPVRASTWFSEWVRNRFHVAVVGFALRYPRSVVAVWAAVAIACSAGAMRVRIETDVTRWFPIGGVVRDSYDRIGSSLSGISPMNVVVTGDGADSIVDPTVLYAIDQLASALRRNEDVGKVVSIADPLRELHGELLENSNDPLPSDRRLIAQYLILLETRDQFRDLLTPDRSSANILLRINNNGSEHLLGVADFAQRWWVEHGVPGVTIRTTGIMYEFARAQHAIAIGQLQGLALDLLTIALILIVIFRVRKLAMIALVPNAIPLALIFGGLGFAGIPIDAGTVVVGTLALGIAVDETVFILSAFMTNRAQPLFRNEVIEKSVREMLPALLATTTAVAVGFTMLVSSDFAFTQKLGGLTAGVMVICVAANVTLLPALLTFVRMPGEEAQSDR